MDKFPNKNVLIVGAGLAGATIARVLAEQNVLVTIVERRDHIAGNIYDFENKNAERIHKYGPHLLHCNNNSIALKFLNRFTEWVEYEHKVRALLKDGRTTPLPINQITLEDIYNKKFKDENEVKLFLESIRNKNIKPNNSDELFESTVGNKLSDIFFRPYTKKMWGTDPTNLSIGIGARLPVRTNKDVRYFNDNFQALPKYGYTNMIEKMLYHKNISIFLNTSFQKDMEKNFDQVFICMPIDKYFNYQYGVLPYRSIKFEHRLENINDQAAPVINFTDEKKYTRKTQWSLLPNSYHKNLNLKTISYEVPCSMELNPNEYYYPVNTKSSKLLYEKYKLLAKKRQKITFCGRTGLFRYIDMIPTVLLHLEIAKKYLSKLNR